MSCHSSDKGVQGLGSGGVPSRLCTVWRSLAVDQQGGSMGAATGTPYWTGM
jgi:hypothetical protein